MSLYCYYDLSKADISSSNRTFDVDRIINKRFIVRMKPFKFYL